MRAALDRSRMHEGAAWHSIAEMQAVVVVGGRELCDEVAAALGAELTVHPAYTVEAALRIAARQPPSLLLFDEPSLGASPLQVFESLRAISPGVRAIVISASMDADHLAKFKNVGPVVRHPLDPERLRATVKNALRLSAMATGVNRMRETGRFDLREEIAAFEANERKKGGA